MLLNGFIPFIQLHDSVIQKIKVTIKMNAWQYNNAIFTTKVPSNCTASIVWKKSESVWKFLEISE